MEGDRPDQVKKAATVVVPSTGGGPPAESKEPEGPAPVKPDDKTKTELSEEDLALKAALDAAVEQTKDPNPAVAAAALELIAKEVRDTTSTMTAVPKPLKFLTPHYPALVAGFASVAPGNAVLYADILSVLGMVAAHDTRDCMKYKLQGNRKDLGSWGHEFVRHLAGEISEEYNTRTTSDPPSDVSDLIEVVHIIVPFHMSHNAEAEAIDLLMETQQLTSLRSGLYVDPANCSRVCLYLLKCADYAADPEEAQTILDTVFLLFLQQRQYPDAVRVAIKASNPDRVQEVFASCEDVGVKKQMALILGRHGVVVDLGDHTLNELAGNATLTSEFGSLARELDVVEAKTPEDIYKTHLSQTGSTRRSEPAAQVDSARGNLASTFVNAFVNAGYTTDKLVTPLDSQWLHKNRGNALFSVTASLGLILQWNSDELSQIDKFLASADPATKGGALLGIGLCCAKVRNEVDAAFAVLSEYLDESVPQPKEVRIGALLGLGVAYAGSAREDVKDLFIPFIVDTSATADMEIVSFAGLALGLLFVGTAHGDSAAIIAERLMESSPAELDNPIARHLCVGLALLYLGRTEVGDAMLLTLDTISHDISKFAKAILTGCAYAGTGNVLTVQKLLHVCAEHPQGEAEKSLDAGAPAIKPTKFIHQSAAVIGLALVTMGEELAVDMASRMVDHLLQYGDPAVRRAVPLALATIHVSDPAYSVVDTLSKLTHDSDADTAMSAIIALGIIGAGTNNSRIAGLLRQLTVFYEKEPNQLFVTRLAQGLLHMGKGLLSLNPFHSDRLLVSGPAIGGLLTVLVAALDFPATILDKHHYLMFLLSPAMFPRCLVTLDEDLKPVHVSVRVGQAVEMVGQVGRPKTITGFQTHTTPVLLAAKERAELASDEYTALTSVLEGFVILRKNPAAAAPAAAAKP